MYLSLQVTRVVLCFILANTYSALLVLLKPNIRVIPVAYLTHSPPVMNSEGQMESVIFMS